MDTIENYLIKYQQQLELLISKPDLKSCKLDFDKLWEIIQNFGFNNAIEITLTYEHVYDIKRKSNWLEIFEYFMSRKNDKFIQAIDNSRFLILLNRLISGEELELKKKAIFLLSIITRKCSVELIKNFIELRKRIENELAEYFTLFDTMDSDYFQTKVKLQILETTNPQGHNISENTFNQQTLYHSTSTNNTINIMSNNSNTKNTQLFHHSASLPILTIDMVKRSEKRIPTIAFTPKLTLANSGNCINKNYFVSSSEINLTKNVKVNSFNDLDSIQSQSQFQVLPIQTKSTKKKHPILIYDPTDNSQTLYGKNIEITEIPQKSSNDKALVELNKSNINVQSNDELKPMPESAISIDQSSNVIIANESSKKTTSPLCVLINPVPIEKKNQAIITINSCSATPKKINESQDQDKFEKELKEIIPKIKQKLDLLVNAQKNLDSLEPSKDHEIFIKNYESLTNEIQVIKQDLKKIFSSKPDDSKENDQLIKVITQINDDILQIEQSICQKKQEFINKEDLVKTSKKLIQKQNAQQFIKSKTIGHIKNDSSTSLMTFDELLSFKTLQCPNEKCPDRIIIENKVLKDDSSKYNDSNPDAFEKFLYLTCSYYHTKTDKRRFLLTKIEDNIFSYTNKRICRGCLERDEHESNCYYCKNYYEFYYHPANYKIKKCISSKCQFKYCPFFHIEDERIEWENILAKINQLTRTNMKFKSIIIRSTTAFEPDGFFTSITKPIETSGSKDIAEKSKEELQRDSNIHGNISELKVDIKNNGLEQNYIQFKQIQNEVSNTKPLKTFYRLFKGSNYSENDYYIIIKYICSLLNIQGGILYLGVDEITKCIYGIEMNLKRFKEFKLNILNSLKDKFEPFVPEIFIHIIRYPVLNPETITDKTNNIDADCYCIIKIEVIPDTNIIQKYYLKFRSNNDLKMILYTIDEQGKIHSKLKSNCEENAKNLIKQIKKKNNIIWHNAKQQSRSNLVDSILRKGVICLAFLTDIKIQLSILIT